jgi:cell division protein FtsW
MASTTTTSSRPRAIAPDADAASASGKGGLAARVNLGKVFAPVPSEFLLITSTALMLTGFGLVMILSATSATATARGEAPYEAVIKQGVFALIGIPLMLVASRLPVEFW